jgi:cardiolipin synthase
MKDKKLQTRNSFTTANRVQLIRGGAEYFDVLVRLINQAKENIHLQSYIYADDKTGRLVANALKIASKRNVKVYLLVDGYASQAISKLFIHEMREAGIQFRFFNPLFKTRYFYFGRRVHHKVAVVDMKYALVGGINIADRYNDLPGKPAWLDFALYTEGEIARQLCILCWKTWKGYPPNMGLTACEEKETYYDIPAGDQIEVRMRRNDWVRHKNEISATYIEMLHNAKKEVIIVCSYFLPGKVIRRQMVNAIKRGVSVKVMVAGRSDIMTAKYAERWLYDWLLRNGIELYEYQKNILHAKLAVCDNILMTIGSYNINDISTYASIELNLDVRNPFFVQQVRLTIQDIIEKHCIRITQEQHCKTKNVLKQFVRWVSYEFIRMMFYLFTFYFKRRN